VQSENQDISRPARWTFDTRPFRGHEAFEALEDLNGRSPTPLSLYYSGGPFRSRVEVLQLDKGIISRAKSTPSFSSEKTAENIARSEAPYDTLVLMLSGSVAVRRGDTTRRVRAGEFCLLPGREVHAFTPLPGSACGHLTLVVPSARLGRSGGLDKEACETIEARATEPLRQCLTSLASNFSDYSIPEAAGLFDACVHLIRAQGLRLSSSSDTCGAATDRIRHLLRFIDANLADPGLCAAYAAAELGVSERRIHQMLASIGTTFRSNVSEKRIRYAAADLSARPQGQPIWEIACRWGFPDGSTFRKAFRKVFSCSPSEFQRGSHTDVN
jgi:AraC family transcriptional activator of tynA and feaB